MTVGTETAAEASSSRGDYAVQVASESNAADAHTVFRTLQNQVPQAARQARAYRAPHGSRSWEDLLPDHGRPLCVNGRCDAQGRSARGGSPQTANSSRIGIAKESLLLLPPRPPNGFRILPAGGGDWSTF